LYLIRIKLYICFTLETSRTKTKQVYWSTSEKRYCKFQLISIIRKCNVTIYVQTFITFCFSFLWLNGIVDMTMYLANILSNKYYLEVSDLFNFSFIGKHNTINNFPRSSWAEYIQLTAFNTTCLQMNKIFLRENQPW
jgi:hypothetical protein